MFFRSIICLCIYAAVVSAADVERDWDYMSQGMDWIERNDTCAGHERQSPIHVDALMAHWGNDGDYFSVYYALPELIEVQNDQTSIKVYGSGKKSLGTLEHKSHEGSHKFELAWIEFHAPSEHTMQTDSGMVRRMLECQLIHKRVDAPDNAPAHYAIVSLLFDVVDDDSGSSNDAFLDTILSKPLPQGNYAGHTIAVPSVSSSELQELVQPAGEEDNEFFYYRGSLTHPPCSPTAIWIIKAKPMLATKAQADRFTQRMRFFGTEGNWRVVQNANGVDSNQQPLVKIRHQIGDKEREREEFELEGVPETFTEKFEEFGEVAGEKMSSARDYLLKNRKNPVTWGIVAGIITLLVLSIFLLTAVCCKCSRKCLRKVCCCCCPKKNKKRKTSSGSDSSGYSVVSSDADYDNERNNTHLLS
eukprot:GHVR01062117.1.p1 GENE.GHVR01062117.1~~GHVR01062117.1.p1  ORF type:complete len:416 (-),score=78.29 GHVR01062117.1:202-1449(-)